MSRSGYTEDVEDNWELIKWRGAVASAIRGKRGQNFLKEMLIALDAIPTKELISTDLENLEGCCALGAVGRARQLDMTTLDPYDFKTVAASFGIACALVREIMFENDDGVCYWCVETPSQRWDRVRRWVVGQICTA